MDKVDWLKPGGFPLVLDDLLYEQNAMKDALKGIISTFIIGDSKIMVLSGCYPTYVTGTQNPVMYNVPEGYAYFRDEIFKVETSNVPFFCLEDQWYFGVVEGTDSAGVKTFEDGTTSSVYKTRRLKLFCEYDNNAVKNNTYNPVLHEIWHPVGTSRQLTPGANSTYFPPEPKTLEAKILELGFKKA